MDYFRVFSMYSSSKETDCLSFIFTSCSLVRHFYVLHFQSTLPWLEVDDVGDGVGVGHARFSTYCVKSVEGNVVARSLAFSCNTQMDDDTSTATHVDICRQRVIQLCSDVSGCHVPPGDTRFSRRFHVSHTVKHTYQYEAVQHSSFAMHIQYIHAPTTESIHLNK